MLMLTLWCVSENSALHVAPHQRWLKLEELCNTTFNGFKHDFKTVAYFETETHVMPQVKLFFPQINC